MYLGILNEVIHESYNKKDPAWYDRIGKGIVKLNRFAGGREIETGKDAHYTTMNLDNWIGKKLGTEMNDKKGMTKKEAALKGLIIGGLLGGPGGALAASTIGTGFTALARHLHDRYYNENVDIMIDDTIRDCLQETSTYGSTNGFDELSLIILNENMTKDEMDKSKSLYLPKPGSLGYDIQKQFEDDRNRRKDQYRLRRELNSTFTNSFTTDEALSKHIEERNKKGEENINHDLEYAKKPTTDVLNKIRYTLRSGITIPRNFLAKLLDKLHAWSVKISRDYYAKSPDKRGTLEMIKQKLAYLIEIVSRKLHNFLQYGRGYISNVYDIKDKWENNPHYKK